jgi:transcriptional regulator with XRE-family HTH domain
MTDIKPFRLLFDADLKRAEWTQSDVADALKVKQQAISSWRSRNMVPFRRQPDLIALFKDKLGEDSEMVQAFARHNLNQSMGHEVLDLHMSGQKNASWERREEYVNAASSVASKGLSAIDKIRARRAGRDPIGDQKRSDPMGLELLQRHKARQNLLDKSSLGTNPLKQGLFDLRATSETIKAHDKFLKTLELEFPDVEVRKTLRHLESDHQFDLCIDDKICFVSSGCFGTGLGSVRDFPRYAIYAIKIAAWANTMDNRAFVLAHGTYGASKSELITMERIAENMKILNLHMVLLPGYNAYFELVGNMYSNADYHDV